MDEHLEHLELVISRVEGAGMKLKPSKCQFVRQEVEYLGHIITPEGLKANPKLVDAVNQFLPPKDVHGVRRFLGMASYYRRFIRHFAKLAEPLHHLTGKDVPFQWTPACQEAFDALKAKLTVAPVLAYPAFDQDFVLETDASIHGLGAVLSQCFDGKSHPVAYASRALSRAEKNYSITELETLAVVWAVNHFRHCLYGRAVTVYTDHSAVKAVLATPNPTGKHARWWNKVYGSGISKVAIIYRAGKENVCADALSRSPVSPTPPDLEVPADVLSVQTTDIPALLNRDPDSSSLDPESFRDGQQQDPWIHHLTQYLTEKKLPDDESVARRIVLQAPSFDLQDGILYFIDSKHNHRKRAVVPHQLQQQLLGQTHSGPFGGHFSGQRTFNNLALHWWWNRMYSDTMEFCKNCPQCAAVSGFGRNHKPPLHPIPVSRPFEIFGVDIMELPKTSSGNSYVVVFQDLFTKWPFVFPVPDQQSIHIVRLLTEHIVPFCGVPEALLSDRGANLLSHLMLDVCKSLGIRKLNTTAYHPQCDSVVEHFNRTLKAMLRKHAEDLGRQWDRYLPGLLWAYRNTPHESTGERPSFLVFGVDCRSPSEACLLPTSVSQPSNLDDYREELALSLSTARSNAALCIRRSQAKYKKGYDRTAKETQYRVGQWVLVRFPCEETGKNRKLSRPWHGPYRIVAINDPDVSVTKVYFPNEKSIQVHQSRVCLCPINYPAGYYWYGGRQQGIGRHPSWIDRLEPNDGPLTSTSDITSDDEGEMQQPTHQQRYALRKRSGHGTRGESL